MSSFCSSSGTEERIFATFYLTFYFAGSFYFGVSFYFTNSDLTVKVKHEPMPHSDPTIRSPLRHSAMFLQMLRPSPLPFGFNVLLSTVVT